MFKIIRRDQAEKTSPTLQLQSADQRQTDIKFPCKNFLMKRIMLNPSIKDVGIR